MAKGSALTVYGHSYTPVPGFYVSAGGEWSTRLANKLGMTRTSYGASGARMIEMAARAIGTTVPGIGAGGAYPAGAAGAVVIECEMNDALFGPATTAGRAGFTHALRSLIATVTAAQRIEASTGTPTSTWGTFSDGIFSNGSVRTTDNVDAPLTFTGVSAPGGKVHVLTTAHAAGSDTGTINAVIPVTVPTTGTHTIAISKAAGDSRFIYIDALLVPGATPPPVLVCKDPPVGNLTSAPNQAAWAANSPALHTIIDSVTAEFPTAKVVDLGPGWDVSTMVADADTASQFHPGDVGMPHIANKLEQPLIGSLVSRLATKMWT